MLGVMYSKHLIISFSNSDTQNVLQVDRISSVHILENKREHMNVIVTAPY